MINERNVALAALDRAQADLALCREERDRALASSKEHYEQWGKWQVKADQLAESLKKAEAENQALKVMALGHHHDRVRLRTERDAWRARYDGVNDELRQACLDRERLREQVDTMLRENDDLREQLASVDTCVSDDAVALRVAVEENARLLAERDRLAAVLAETPENRALVYDTWENGAAEDMDGAAGEVLAALRTRAGV